MSVAGRRDLPEPKRTGLAIFILANDPGKLTAKAIKVRRRAEEVAGLGCPDG
ncbi:MAG: hypothetical protein IPJ94_10980 [Chloroflexi bacterium]|nr:hypothetical protein [Chloroflexota bacterium]